MALFDKLTGGLKYEELDISTPNRLNKTGAASSAIKQQDSVSDAFDGFEQFKLIDNARQLLSSFTDPEVIKTIEPIGRK